MKYLLLIFLINVFFVSAYSQDIIVTSTGDSINCRISKVKSEYIYFIFKHNGEIRNTLISIDDVQNYKYDYYPTSEVPKRSSMVKANYNHFKFAFSFGNGNLLGGIAENMSSWEKCYYRELMRGACIDAKFHYSITDLWNVGLIYNLLVCSNYMKEALLVDPNDGSYYYGEFSDMKRYTYLGPSLTAQSFSFDKRNSFIFGLSMGYVKYTNSYCRGDEYKDTGHSIVGRFDLGYDINIIKDLSLGLQFALTLGSLKEIEFDDGNTVETINLKYGSYISLDHVDFTIGLRYSL